MALLRDWLDHIKRYANYKPRELKAAIITIAVLALAISFNKWGVGREVNLSYGFMNLVGALIVVAISFFGRDFFQKVMSLGVALKIEYQMWSMGLLLTLLLVFLTNGKLWFIVPGGILIHYMPGNRIGYVRYGLNQFAIGMTAFWGPIGNLILAIFWKTLFSITGVALFKTAFIFNIVWAIWAIIPIPPSDGSKVFFGARLLYMWALAFILSVSGFLYFSNFNIILTIIISMIIAGIWWLIFYIVWERFNWKGPYY